MLVLQERAFWGKLLVDTVQGGAKKEILTDAVLDAIQSTTG
jgi:hypothetical protein